MNSLEYLERLHACAMFAWNKCHLSYTSKETYEMWHDVYTLFANERDLVGCMV